MLNDVARGPRDFCAIGTIVIAPSQVICLEKLSSTLHLFPCTLTIDKAERRERSVEYAYAIPMLARTLAYERQLVQLTRHGRFSLTNQSRARAFYIRYDIIVRINYNAW